MKTIVLLLMVLGTVSTAYSKVDCNRHKIYCKIVELNPSIDTELAFRLSNILYVKSKQYGTDPMISVAISAQESSLRNINRTVQGVPEWCAKQKSYCPTQTIITDVGFFQLHVGTIKNYGFNLPRLMTDIEYQIDCHLIILKKKIKNCAFLGDEAWSCYHSTTPKHRLKYVKDVSRYID